MKTLSDVEFQLLALLTTREKSGREIALHFEKETGRVISYGTLYTTLRRLREAGCVDSKDSEDADGRVRSFVLTGNGRIALANTRKSYSELATFGLSMGGRS